MAGVASGLDHDHGHACLPDLGEYEVHQGRSDASTLVGRKEVAAHFEIAEDGSYTLDVAGFAAVAA